MDNFYLTVDQVALLTPRQKAELYCHRRDKQGKLVAPEGRDSPFKSEAAELAALEAFNKALGGSLHGFDKIKDGVRRRWATREQAAEPVPAKPQIKTFGGG